MYDVLAFLISHSSAIWGGASGLGVVLVHQFWPSAKDKKIAKREDFKAITDSLFKELESLKNDVEDYKNDSEDCERKYNELQTKFVEFKGKYNELELRYQIQVNINKKISDEIKSLEAQIQAHVEKEKALTVNDSNNNNEGFSLRAPSKPSNG